MKKKRLFLTCMILLLPSLAYLGLRSGHSVKAGTNVWTTNGPYQSGVTVKALTIQPGSPSTLWVGTDKGIYKSTNAAESWVPKNSGLTGYGGLVVTDIAINPSSTNVMYIGTWGSGVYKSTDGGESWVQANNGLPGRSVQGAMPSFGGEAGAPEVPRLGPSPEFDSHPGADMQTATAKGVPWTPIRKLAINPSNPDMLYAAISGNYGVYRSTDGGNSWTESLTVGSARTVVINPASPNILYAAIDNDGIYKSVDGGDNWVRVSAELSKTRALAIDPASPNTIYAGIWGGGILKSTDGGSSWTAINNGLGEDLYVLSLAVAPSAPNVIYAGTYSWVYRSTDGGNSWTLTDPNFPSYYVDAIAVDPTNPNTIYVGSNMAEGGGVFKSTDGGSTLIAKNVGLLNTIVYSIARDPANPQTIYAGTWGGGVFKSTDGGQNWVEKNGADPNDLWLPYVYALAISPAAPQIIYAGTAYDNAGVFKSTDYGESWTEMSNGLPGDDKDIFSLAVDPSNPNIVCAGTENNIFKSTNGGADWTATNGVPQGTQVLALAINPQSPNVLYAGTFGAGVYKSTDAGDNWTAVNNGLDNLYVYDLAIDPTSPDTIYAGTANKVYKSTDGGGNWALASNGLPDVAIRALSIDSTMPSVLYAGTHNQGMYRSPNGGGSWGAFNNGLGNLQIRALTVGSGNPPPIYAGTEGDGVWQYSLVFGYKICLPFIAKNYLPPAPPAAKYAVVIGVADYQHIDDLDYTDDDAQDMYNTLINNCGFQPSNISLLINSAATKSGIQNAITNWLASREGPDDLVMIFFSGHGGSGPDVPPLGDEADGRDEYLCPYDALTDSWANDIADDELDVWLGALDSSRIMVIIDCSYSGGMIQGAMGIGKTIARSRKASVGDGFAKDIDRTGRVVLTASDDDQTSFEFDALQNGVFTYYLVEGLQTPAADVNGNGSVSVEEAYSYLRDRVDNYVLAHVPYPDNNNGEGQDAQLYDGVPGEVDLSTPSVGPVLLYEDNFSDPNSGWPIYEDANVKYEYLDGEYRILVKDSHRWAAASAPGVKFSDFTLEADGRHATGAYGSYGLVFGITDGWEGFYTFEVNADREYSIWKYTADDGWQALKDWTYSSYIKGGRTANHLKVIRDSSRIEAYVNGHYLTTVTDNSFIGSLRVGLVAQAYNVPNVDARFDNFKVFSVGGSAAGAEETAGGADFDTRPEGSDAR